MRGRRSFLTWTVLALLVCIPALGATVDSIPRPAPGTWSVDTTETLRPETLAEVNRLGTEINASGQGQIAVVMVDSTEGVQPRAFATELFNNWGIGHADRDDGALLFVAMGDRKVEIVLGDGVDTAEDVERSDALMARITPLFARGDPDAAVLEGTRGLGTLLAQASGSAPAGNERRDAGRTVPGWLVPAFLASFVLLWLWWTNHRTPRKPPPPGQKKGKKLRRFAQALFIPTGGGYIHHGGYSGGGYSGGGGGSSGGSSSGGGSSGGW
jgi:uncharacterized protein